MIDHNDGDVVDVETVIGTFRGVIMRRVETPDGPRFSVRIERGHPFARGVLCAVTTADIIHPPATEISQP